MSVRISKGKYDRLLKLSDDRGLFVATAIDQRGSLRKSLGHALGGEADARHVAEFKRLVSEELTPYSSAILLDPEYGWDAAEARHKDTGLLIAYEETGYDATEKGRLPDLLPEWSVRRYAEKGVDAIKILMYYDPDDDEKINTIKHAFIERVGAECESVDIPFFFEAVTYSDTLKDSASAEFAKAKPEKVKKYMREFTQPKYKIDVLKVEVPINLKYVEGTRAGAGGEAVYTREEAIAHFKATAGLTSVPFIYLSAGVTNEMFMETLELAGEAGVPFSGVLCGRATWQDGVEIYGKHGAEALRAWLKDEGVRRMIRMGEILSKAATPWWDFYGGKDKIEVVEREKTGV
ncbi:tagatose 1,6-diphosphate aldolase [Paenibacillus sp. 7124]|uniref:Tagatose 1,6-diphosphate aldolase n=1 Tax=Paenibacillus apii TaxID=1850370 RepID=A0A6M1PC65_9BACL|nr:tagatose 1,6-diphosphate aldolase [Paenibacillus apii]NGM80860.1 tagatose 1,6-diphosphate aldolase [Paenibacillus apii]NJJ40795.1 tagatose 1,6-diphosphate aldolase [Paenibacillus apii]